jgi:YD repeat-containing protein
MVASVGAGVGLVSGNGLGTSLSSLATLGDRGVFGSGVQGRSSEHTLVNLANGNLVVQDSDELLVGTGLAANTLRTYNSQGSFGGSNWAVGVERKQVSLQGSYGAAGSTMTRTDEDGASAVYAWDAAAGLYRSTAGGGAYDTLQLVAGEGVYAWTDGASSQVERYQVATGLLDSTTDASGHRVQYIFANGRLASVTDASGESTQFVYSGNLLDRLVTAWTDENGQQHLLTRVHYEYDSAQRLSRVVVDLSPGDNSIADDKVYATDYTYEGSSVRLHSILQSDGTGVTVGYVLVNGDYRVQSVLDNSGALTQFAYDTANGRTAVTDPTGVVTRYDYDAQGRAARSNTTPMATSARSMAAMAAACISATTATATKCCSATTSATRSHAATAAASTSC